MTQSTTFAAGTVVTKEWLNAVDEHVFDEYVSIKQYGAVGDSTTDDTAAIQAAIDAVAAYTVEDGITGYNGFGGTVFVPHGTYLITNTITLKRGVKLIGESRKGSVFLVSNGGFPSNSNVITLGQLGVNEFGYGSRIESLAINCNYRADLIGVAADHTAEGAGLVDVFIRGTYRPVRFYRETGLTSPASPTETYIEHCEFWTEGSGGPGGPYYAIDFDNLEQSNVIRDTIVYDINNDAGAGSAAVRVNGCNAEITHLHSERIETGILVSDSGSSGSSRVHINDVEHYNGNALYGVYIDSSATTTLVIANNIQVNNATTAHTIYNVINGDDYSDATASKLAQYAFYGSAVKSALYSDSLKLKNTASSNATTLDWYEEGSFTPTLAFGGAVVGLTYSEQVGKFTRIGNRVLFNLSFTLSAKGSSTGNAELAGLPYFASSDPSIACAVRFNSGVAGVGALTQSAAVISTTKNIRVYEANGFGQPTQLTDTAFTNTSVVDIAGQYLV